MVMRYYFALALVATLLAALSPLASVAGAGVPSGPLSSSPQYIVGSPDGAFVADVLVRDIALNPVSGSYVSLDFSTCAQFNYCVPACTDCTVDPVARTVHRFTDVSGHAVFNLRVGGGSCPDASHLRVSADGVLLGSSRFSSLDQDGDLSVTTADVAQVQAVLGSHDTRADFDGDQLVTAADVAIVQAHLGASCAAPTTARKDTWGALKSVYR
jgi:hypothetical protein